ncbi:class I SAM-dependent methyltransferase [Pseudomonas sp. NPDC090233]|uniref:class I SAM-dependent methyltransferase n=1 Tax=Pseudomonas sp. NPDC090233 TaxID=3364479 RepID=UPI00383BC0BC
MKQLFEPIGPALNALFVLTVEGVEYLGRKQRDEHQELGSRLTPDMLYGRLLKSTWSDQGLNCSYQPIASANKHALFRQALLAPHNRVHFPFPVLGQQCEELFASADYWNNPEPLATNLDRQEQHFRDACHALLEKRLPEGALVHDPACSTGTFIASIARTLPWVRCIGADASLNMIEHARRHHRSHNLAFRRADAHTPAVPPASCDALILRFLNAEVMPRQTAVNLFHSLARLLRADGVMILFGHTPLLFEVGVEARRAGLMVHRSLAGTVTGDSLFQFYHLEP